MMREKASIERFVFIAIWRLVFSNKFTLTSLNAELRKFYRLQNRPIIVFHTFIQLVYCLQKNFLNCFYFSIEVTPNPSWRCLRASNLFHSLFTSLYQWFDAIHWLLYFVTGAVRRHEIPPKGYPVGTLQAFWSKRF